MIKMKPLINKKSGYTVIELVFYITLFTVISFVVINAMMTMAKSFKETTITADWQEGAVAIERISREIRSSYDTGSITATDLNLNTKDTNGNNKTVEFLLAGANIQLLENGTLTGNLNTPNIAVTALTFTQITTLQSKAVKISLTFKSTNDPLARTQDLNDTIVLRGVY